MERPTVSTLRIGEWRVEPTTGEISRNGHALRLDVRAMRLLACLADHSGEVVSIDELIEKVWQGVAVSQDSVYQAVASLRRQLGDDPKQPTYIETVPRLGYRLVAPVSEDEAAPTVSTETQAAEAGSSAGTLETRRKGISAGRRRLVIVASTIVCVAAFLMLMTKDKPTEHAPAVVAAPLPQPLNSIAVLPFLDLTEGMKAEEFADGVTEELIDKLSNVPGLRVSAPTASFYFKGKQVPTAEIAKTLGVTYLLDGSVRKSGKMVRIAARLLRADNGYVLWSESYDWPLDDILMIQDDIANKTTTALKTSIGAGLEPVK